MEKSKTKKQGWYFGPSSPLNIAGNGKDEIMTKLSRWDYDTITKNIFCLKNLAMSYEICLGCPEYSMGNC